MEISELLKKNNLYYDKNKIEELTKSWLWDKIHILTDFDKTLTKGNSKTSWSLLTNSGLMPEEYGVKRMKYYDQYHPIEINLELSEAYRRKKMNEWWQKHLSLLTEFELKESMIRKVVTDPNLMSFRDGSREFLKMCSDTNVPIVIISAGIGNFIEDFLRINNCLTKNIMIISNFIHFENGIASGFTNKVIHALNKDEHETPQEVKDLITSHPYTIMMGDGIDDIKMISNENRDKTLKIGFLEEKIENNLNEFRKSFDVVCANNSSMSNVTNIMNMYINKMSK